MHICISKPTTIGSDNGLSPSRCQAIIWTNAGILSIGPLGTYFSEILIKIHTFSFKEMHLKMSSGKWRPFCLSLHVLMGHVAWQPLLELLTHRTNPRMHQISHNAPFCNRNVHISVAKCCIVGYGTDAFWDLWGWSIVMVPCHAVKFLLHIWRSKSMGIRAPPELQWLDEVDRVPG